MKRLFVLMMVSAMVVVLVQPVLALQPFPDTGQTKCYDHYHEIACPAPGEPFYGQDAQYQPRIPRSYTKLGMNGVELAVNALHVDDGGPWIMTRDNVTGLIWEIKTEANKDDEYNWQDAQDVFIAGLNSAGFGGFSDWRMPEVGELSSLVDAGVFDPAVDVEWFPKTASSRYWSSSTSASSTLNAWVVYFYDGDVSSFHNDKTDSGYVRAVRGGQSGSLDPLVINGDGTVTDPNTALMWQEDTASGTYTWQAALAYTEGLTLAGYSDWRLPNINELKTLVDYSRSNPAIDPVLADKTASSWYWSSSTSANDTYYAWVVYFYYGYGSSSYKTYSGYVRAVRGGQSNIGLFGSLVISIEPAETRNAGAQWRRTGTSAWYNSGATETNIPTGIHTVEFKDVSGWNKPANITVNINAGHTATASGTYSVSSNVLINAALNININCVDVFGDEYAMIFNYINGFTWELDANSIAAAQTGRCQSVDDRLNVHIACADYAGVKLGFTLMYNSNLYWELDVDTLRGMASDECD